MAVNITSRQSFSVSIGGEVVTGEKEKSIAIDGYKFDQTFTLANNTTQKVFDIDEAAIGNFDFLWIESNQDVFVEMVTDDDGDVGEETGVVKSLAGSAFLLHSDDAKANYTVIFAGGSNDVIETIRVRNESGSTATVRVFAAT